MQVNSNPPPIEGWLADVHGFIAGQAPELLPLFEVYSAEARFGRRYIAMDLQRLPAGASVLEVGAGSLLLSCQLVREGFDVTALEPIGSGFSHFERMRELVLNKAQLLGCRPKMLNMPAESMSTNSQFDYAFSVNVMEHVQDVARTLANVGASLKPGATYRFTCPNYMFPYEPHFNSPTLFSKKLTERVLGGKIFSNKTLADPLGTWESLNWIDVIQIRKGIQRIPDLRVEFNRNFLTVTLERIAFDKEFALRRSRWMRVIILALVRLRLHHLASLIPAMFQPVIDCMVIRAMAKDK